MPARPCARTPLLRLLPATARPIVVKLGGSVVRSAELAAWLDAIARRRVPIVVVPGGGALADEVRACQAALGFGDRAAHRMALLAMDQLAWAVAGLRQGFAVGATEAELARRARARRGGGLGALRLDRRAHRHRGILAAHLRQSGALARGRIGAARCYLIKSIARARATARAPRQLARDGIVDAAFPDMLKETGVPAVPARPRRPAGLRRRACRRGGPIRCGAEIDLTPTKRSGLRRHSLALRPPERVRTAAG